MSTPRALHSLQSHPSTATMVGSMGGYHGAGQAFQLLRKASGITQSELARAIGQAQSSVARLEAEDVNPSVATLDRALEAIGKTWFDFAVALQAVDAGLDELPREQGGAQKGTVSTREVGWLAREILHLQREISRAKTLPQKTREDLIGLRREFNDFRDAVTKRRSREALNQAAEKDKVPNPKDSNGPNA